MLTTILLVAAFVVAAIAAFFVRNVKNVDLVALALALYFLAQIVP